MKEDPRLAVTRESALAAAKIILQEEGVLRLTHATVAKATGISRSTLYRHWPDVSSLRDETFRRISTPQKIAPRTNGPLGTDLAWLLSILMGALNETPWGQIAPQVMAAAATDGEARKVIREFMNDRFASVEAIFNAAIERKELPPDIPIRQLIEFTVSVPYFRKLVLQEPLDEEWLKSHVDMICKLANCAEGRSA